MIQSIVTMLPPRPDHEQLLIALNNSYVCTLLNNKAGFHTVAIGAPPGVHRTVYICNFLEFDLHMLTFVQQERKDCRGVIPIPQNQTHSDIFGGACLYYCQGYH